MLSNARIVYGRIAPLPRLSCLVHPSASTSSAAGGRPHRSTPVISFLRFVIIIIIIIITERQINNVTLRNLSYCISSIHNDNILHHHHHLLCRLCFSLFSQYARRERHQNRENHPFLPHVEFHEFQLIHSSRSSAFSLSLSLSPSLSSSSFFSSSSLLYLSCHVERLVLSPTVAPVRSFVEYLSSLSCWILSKSVLCLCCWILSRAQTRWRC